MNLEKLLMDVFKPIEGETVLLMCDLPHNGFSINDRWVKRFKVASIWQEGFKKIGERMNFKVHPVLYYDAAGLYNMSLPKYGRMDDKEVVIEEVLKETDTCIALTEFSALVPLMRFKRFRSLRVGTMERVLEAMKKTV